MSHGTRDQMLSHADALLVKHLLDESGAKVEFVEFSGGHSIGPVVLAKLLGFLKANVN